jgi:hypothetical protein
MGYFALWDEGAGFVLWFVIGLYSPSICRAACATIWPPVVAELIAYDRQRLLGQLSHSLCDKMATQISNRLLEIFYVQFCRKLWQNCHFWGVGQIEGSHTILNVFQRFGADERLRQA